MSNRIFLHFYGPYDLCSEVNDILHDCPYTSDQGIYLWAVKMTTGNYRVSYIGETGVSFYKRMKEHLIQKLGGNYQICDPEAMKRGEHKVIWNGLWRKGTRDKMPEFFSQYESLAPTIKKCISTLKLFVAPIKLESHQRRVIEGALAEAIKSDEMASSLLPKDIRYYRSKDTGVLVSCTSDKPIEGLPKQFEV